MTYFQHAIIPSLEHKYRHAHGLERQMKQPTGIKTPSPVNATKESLGNDSNVKDNHPLNS